MGINKQPNLVYKPGKEGFMKKLIVVSFILSLVPVLVHCGGTGSGTDGSNTEGTNTDSTYAPNIAELMASSLPTVLKTGGSVSQDASPGESLFLKGAGTVDIPWGDESGEGNDPPVGNILWLFWNYDYTNQTTTDTIASGECFRVRPSTYDGSEDTWIGYCKPTVLSDPTKCTNGHYSDISASTTSILQKACLFDLEIAENSSEVDSCYSSTGTTVDISEYIPWSNSWGLSQNYTFQGSAGDSRWAQWFKINRDIGNDNTQTIATLYSADTIKGMSLIDVDHANNRITFVDISNYANATQGFNAYIGTLPDATTGETTGAFEAIQWLDYNGIGSMGDERFIIRMKSDGQYIWVQNFSNKVPGVDDDFDVTSPMTAKCAKLQTNLPSSTYVDDSYCLIAFDKASVSELNADSWYTLRIDVPELVSNNWYEKGDTWYSATDNPLAELGSCYPATTPATPGL